MSVQPTRRDVIVSDPPLARFLFADTRSAWIWLILRVWLGYGWLTAGVGKLTGDAWLSGAPLRGFWEAAVAVPATGQAPIIYDWYRAFIQLLLDTQATTWFAPLVAVGEVVIGVALIVGAFTGIAAFLGGFMNWNFIMAGAAASNGMMIVAAVLLVLAWKVAGWWGADRWLLPRLGTPWDRPSA